MRPSIPSTASHLASSCVATAEASAPSSGSQHLRLVSTYRLWMATITQSCGGRCPPEHKSAPIRNESDSRKRERRKPTPRLVGDRTLPEQHVPALQQPDRSLSSSSGYWLDPRRILTSIAARFHDSVTLAGAFKETAHEPQRQLHTGSGRLKIHDEVIHHLAGSIASHRGSARNKAT